MVFPGLFAPGARGSNHRAPQLILVPIEGGGEEGFLKEGGVLRDGSIWEGVGGGGLGASLAEP